MGPHTGWWTSGSFIAFVHVLFGFQPCSHWVGWWENLHETSKPPKTKGFPNVFPGRFPYHFWEVQILVPGTRLRWRSRRSPPADFTGSVPALIMFSPLGWSFNQRWADESLHRPAAKQVEICFFLGWGFWRQQLKIFKGGSVYPVISDVFAMMDR